MAGMEPKKLIDKEDIMKVLVSLFEEGEISLFGMLQAVRKSQFKERIIDEMLLVKTTIKEIEGWLKEQKEQTISQILQMIESAFEDFEAVYSCDGCRLVSIEKNRNYKKLKMEIGDKIKAMQEGRNGAKED